MTDPIHPSLCYAVPSMIIIGPDKAGTDWIHAALQSVSTIHTVHSKELFFFDQQYDRGSEWYWDQLGSNPAPLPWVEIGHDYLFNPLAAKRVGELLPNAQVAAVVRDPIERAVSAHAYMNFQGRCSTKFEDSLGLHHELLSHGLYSQNLGPFIRELGLDRVSLLDFDLLRTEPLQFVSNIVTSLGAELPASWAPPPPMNVRRGPRSARLNHAARNGLSLVRNVLGPNMASTLKRQSASLPVFQKPAGPKERLSANTEDLLMHYFLPDLQALDLSFGSKFGARFRSAHMRTDA